MEKENFLSSEPNISKYFKNNKVEGGIIFEPVSPEVFIEQRDRLPRSLYAFLDIHKKEDYERMMSKLFLSRDKHCGFGINPDGCLLSVFSLEKERGPHLAQEALVKGAKNLSCMGEKLRELYEAVGFQVTIKEDFNSEVVPPYWDYDRFGTPNYYEMKLEE